MNWKTKLSSRKFWVAVSGFVSAVLVALNIPELTISQVVTIITALGVLVSYIFAESYTDSKNPPKEDDKL